MATVEELEWGENSHNAPALPRPQVMHGTMAGEEIGWMTQLYWGDITMTREQFAEQEVDYD